MIRTCRQPSPKCPYGTPPRPCPASNASNVPTNTVLTWNRAAEKLYGYPARQIVGQPASVLGPPDKIAEQRRLLVAAARGDAITECDTQRLHKDGSLLNLSVTLSPIMHAGSLTGFCAVHHDISDRVRTRDTLENKIGKRTRQLHSNIDGQRASHRSSEMRIFISGNR